MKIKCFKFTIYSLVFWVSPEQPELPLRVLGTGPVSRWNRRNRHPIAVESTLRCSLTHVSGWDFFVDRLGRNYSCGRTSCMSVHTLDDLLVCDFPPNNDKSESLFFLFIIFHYSFSCSSVHWFLHLFELLPLCSWALYTMVGCQGLFSRLCRLSFLQRSFPITSEK